MKLSQLSLMLLCGLIISSNAFAISNDKLAYGCIEVGKTKIAEQAKAYGCDVDLNKIEIESIHNAWYSPSKYVWYQVMASCGDLDRVIKMVQYSNGKCF